MTQNISGNNNLATRSEIHMMRRFWHVACGVICFVIYYLADMQLMSWSYICAFIAIIGFFLDFKRSKDEKLNQTFTKLFGPILRRSEKMSFSGLPFYALGVAFSLFVYPADIAILSILFLIFADPIASIVGVYFGKDRLLPNKSLQGTIAVFICCFVIVVVYCSYKSQYPHNIIVFGFFASIAGAISEMMGAFNIDDNLTIPVVSGALMSLINYWFVVF